MTRLGGVPLCVVESFEWIAWMCYASLAPSYGVPFSVSIVRYRKFISVMCFRLLWVTHCPKWDFFYMSNSSFFLPTKSHPTPTHPPTHTHTHTYCAHVHAHTLTCIHTHTHTHKWAHTHTHTHTHTQVGTHTHTHTDLKKPTLLHQFVRFIKTLTCINCW